MDGDTAWVLRSLGGIAKAGDLAAAGVSRARLRGAVARGDVVRVGPRLYADRSIDLHRDTDRRLAALAQAGRHAVLSHQTAAAIWDMRRTQPGEAVHVTVARGARLLGLPGVVAHQSADVERCTSGGWPVTTPRATLVGLAADPDENSLRFNALAAVQRRLVTAAELRDPTAVPRRALGRWNRVAAEAGAGAESGGEGLFWRLVHESRLPDPHLNQWIDAGGQRYRIDALWPRLHLGVEIDGREHHTKVSDFERDHRRQNQIHAQGVMLVRFSVRQVLDDPCEVLRQTSVNLAARSAELGLGPLLLRKRRGSRYVLDCPEVQ